MAEITVVAETGRPSGSRASGRLRAAGKVPGTVYGLGGDAVSVAVDWRTLRHALTGEAGLNALIRLRVDGAEQLTIVKELQRHPVRPQVLHVDFLRVSRDIAIEVEVPIVLTGEAEDVTKADGVIDHMLFHLTISAKPQDIPPELAVDISALQVGDAIRVGDIPLPEGVTTSVDPEEPVVVAQVAQVEELPEAEAAEGEEAEGAEEGEGEQGEAAVGGGDGSGDADNG